MRTVVALESRDGNEGNPLGVVSNLLDKGRRFLDDLVETGFRPASSPASQVHFVDGDDELLDSQREGEESVLSGLTVLRNTGLELSSSGGDDEDTAIGLGGTGDHVCGRERDESDSHRAEGKRLEEKFFFSTAQRVLVA